MVRLRREGREGKYMVHYLVYCMWHDVEARGKAMGVSMQIMIQDLIQIYTYVLFKNKLSVTDAAHFMEATEAIMPF